MNTAAVTVARVNLAQVFEQLGFALDDDVDPAAETFEELTWTDAFGYQSIFYLI